MEVWFCALAGTDAARHNALTGDRRARIELSRRMLAEKSQHRRLHLRSASQGYAPAPAASDSTGYEEDRERLKLEVQGDLRLPP